MVLFSWCYIMNRLWGSRIEKLSAVGYCHCLSFLRVIVLGKEWIGTFPLCFTGIGICLSVPICSCSPCQRKGVLFLVYFIYCFCSLLGDVGYEISVVFSSFVHEFFWVWVSYLFFASFSFRSSCRKNGGRDLCCFISHIHQVLVYCGVYSIVCFDLVYIGGLRNEIHE